MFAASSELASVMEFGFNQNETSAFHNGECNENNNSSGDEIANENFFTTTSYM